MDSLALANVQMHLEKAYKNFFRNPKLNKIQIKTQELKKLYDKCGHGNIQVEDHRIKFEVEMDPYEKHRDIAEKYCLETAQQ